MAVDCREVNNKLVALSDFISKIGRATFMVMWTTFGVIISYVSLKIAPNLQPSSLYGSVPNSGVPFWSIKLGKF